MSPELQNQTPAGAGEAPLRVAAAVIIRGREILIARRQQGTHLAGLWEFPGGKVAAGESPPDAARREAEEETGLCLQEIALLHREEFTYPERRIDIHFYLAIRFSGELAAPPGHELRWVDAADIASHPMPPANAAVLRLIAEQFA